MTEDRGADGARREATKVCGEGSQLPCCRIDVWEELRIEDQRGGAAIQEEVVPLDRRADRRRDDGARKLLAGGLRAILRCHACPPLAERDGQINGIRQPAQGEEGCAMGAPDRAGWSGRPFAARRPDRMGDRYSGCDPSAESCSK